MGVVVPVSGVVGLCGSYVCWGSYEIFRGFYRKMGGAVNKTSKTPRYKGHKGAHKNQSPL